MILWYPLLRAHRAEQRFLLYVRSSHRQYHLINTIQADLAGIREFFNSLLAVVT